MIEMRGYGRTQAIRYVQIDRYIDVERERDRDDSQDIWRSRYRIMQLFQEDLDGGLKQDPRQIPTTWATSKAGNAFA